jgi:hypothetical protein
MLIVPHQLVGIPLTYNASLECIVEAHPTSLNYWCRENEKMIYDSQKYKYANFSCSPQPRNVHLMLETFFYGSLLSSHRFACCSRNNDIVGEKNSGLKD